MTLLDKSSNNKRIAQNTVALYVRMLFLMGISLFTTRVVLQALGVDDYGIYNVVGGIVALFSILSQSLSSANSRFLNFEMGKGDQERLKKVFSTGVSIQIVLSVIIATVCEIVGMWFLDNKMVIPDDRLIAANWVLHLTILTFCINLISVPYNAAIIAHEKMSAFAYISIYEGIAKLLICYLVIETSFDKLIVYSALICLIQLTVRLIYSFYCKRNFEECSYQVIYDKSLLKEIFTYAGWNVIGAGASVIRNQGGNILINLFGGLSVNAARGVANQVNFAVTGFANNFMTAVKPQITKSYAAGDIDYMTTLVNQSARLSFYMLLFLSLPIAINIEYILSIWLKDVPEKTVIFVLLTLAFTLIESLSNPLITAQLSTGIVRNYQMIVGGINLLNLPVSYWLLKSGFPTESFLYVAIFFSCVSLIARLIILKIHMNFDINRFITHVIANCFIVSLISLSIPYAFSLLWDSCLESFIVTSIISFFNTSLVLLFLGCNRRERNLIFNKIKSKIKKLLYRSRL